MTTDGQFDKMYQDALYLDPTKADLTKTEASVTDGVLVVTAPQNAKPEPMDIQAIRGQPPALETDENSGFRVALDMPGVSVNKLSIKIHGNVMLIRGERSIGEEIMVLRRLVKRNGGPCVLAGRSVDCHHCHSYRQSDYR